MALMSAPYISAHQIPEGFSSRAEFDEAVNTAVGHLILTNPEQEFYIVQEGFSVSGCTENFVTILFYDGSTRQFPVRGPGCL